MGTKTFNIATQLTIFRMVLTPVFLYLLFSHCLLCRIGALVAFVIASLTDFYDGYAARKYGWVTRTGQFLDPLADKILVLSAFFSFEILGYIPLWMVLIIVLRDVLMTAFRLYGLHKGRLMRTDYLAKVKTTAQLIFLNFMFVYHILLKVFPAGRFHDALIKSESWYIIYGMMAVVTMITFISGVKYMWNNREQVKLVGHDISRLFMSVQL